MPRQGDERLRDAGGASRRAAAEGEGLVRNGEASATMAKRERGFGTLSSLSLSLSLRGRDNTERGSGRGGSTGGVGPVLEGTGMGAWPCGLVRGETNRATDRGARVSARPVRLGCYPPATAWACVCSIKSFLYGHPARSSM